MRKLAAVAGSAAVILLLAMGARAAASSGETIPESAWALLRGLTWPGALVASLFSPVGKALAGLIASMTPARPSAQDKQLADQLKSIACALSDMAEAVQRSSQVQEQTAATLVKVERSLAILLDRTSR